jgi:hypothetical protein
VIDKKEKGHQGRVRQKKEFQHERRKRISIPGIISFALFFKVSHPSVLSGRLLT